MIGRTMRRRATNAVAWFHRWLGIATCLLLASWFVSGAILLFVPFPALSDTAARIYAGRIDFEKISTGPSAVLTRSADASSLRVIERAGRPVYIVNAPGETTVADAATGRTVPLLDRSSALAIARSLDQRATLSPGPFAFDQWIVHDRFDAYRPFYRIDLPGSEGVQLYLSASTGEIVQRTTARQRFWNWPGAILHWLYLTPLRSDFGLWDRTVWWTSLIAMLGVVAGMVIGFVRTIAVRRAHRPGLTYFRQPWMRWHHLLGLFAGLFATTWILSGWLSVDHGRLFSRGTATAEEAHAYAGLTLAQAAERISIKQLVPAKDASEVRLTALAGQPLLAVTMHDGSRMLIGQRGLLEPKAVDAAIRSGLTTAGFGRHFAAGTAVVANNLYALAEGWPATATRYRGRDVDIYVDRANGQLLTVMDDSRAAYAWIYYAMHSFNIPVLAERPVLRKIVMLLPLSAGFALSITGVVIAWTRLRKTRKPRRVR